MNTIKNIAKTMLTIDVNNKQMKTLEKNLIILKKQWKTKEYKDNTESFIDNDINIISNTTSTKLVKLYKDVFWDTPWNEGFVCKSCWKNYNKKFMWKCNCWNSQLESFYKYPELKQTFTSLSSKKWYSKLLAETLDWKNIAFIWWWKSSLEKINQNKLSINQEELENLKKNILDLYSDFDENDFYYLAEIWVDRRYRWQDIAWKLYRENLKKLKQQWEKFILVRTTKKSDIPYKWFKQMWYKDVFDYNDAQDRVILIYKI